MPQLSAYLSFDGNCAEAMRFYERVLGGRVEAMLRYADAPADAAMPALSTEESERIMYARLALDEQVLMASDATAGHPYPGKQGMALSLAYPTVSDAQRVSICWPTAAALPCRSRKPSGPKPTAR